MQRILVKSDEFYSSYPLVLFLNSDYVVGRLLRLLRSNYFKDYKQSRLHLLIKHYYIIIITIIG